jgi:diphosphomevalonate decarboxylase
MSLLRPFRDIDAGIFKAGWRSPSNIAFVKYWGKKGHQLPANPSFSMTLDKCFTTTKIQFDKSDDLAVELLFDGKPHQVFNDKVKKFLESLSDELAFISRTKFSISTKNTFPHGTGIASSASGLSAIALCLTDFLFEAKGKKGGDDFYEIASFISRLASGSACRSVYGGYTTWGDVSDEFATAFEVHPSLKVLHDDVLVISSEEKKVSSRAGHERMKEHPFAEARFTQARNNFEILKSVMQNGDVIDLGRILEEEALSLHAMMMTSPEGFTLFKPKSIEAMEKVRIFRQETHLPLFFTLDAGPNLHLIYPPSDAKKIQSFIQEELKPLGETLIEDQTGKGPIRC